MGARTTIDGNDRCSRGRGRWLARASLSERTAGRRVPAAARRPHGARVAPLARRFPGRFPGWMADSAARDESSANGGGVSGGGSSLACADVQFSGGRCRRSDRCADGGPYSATGDGGTRLPRGLGSGPAMARPDPVRRDAARDRSGAGLAGFGEQPTGRWRLSVSAIRDLDQRSSGAAYSRTAGGVDRPRRGGGRGWRDLARRLPPLATRHAEPPRRRVPPAAGRPARFAGRRKAECGRCRGGRGGDSRRGRNAARLGRQCGPRFASPGDFQSVL